MALRVVAVYGIKQAGLMQAIFNGKIGIVDLSGKRKNKMW